MPSPAMSRLRTSQSSEDTKRWPLSTSGSSGGMSVQQGFVASRVRALQEQQHRESECKTRPRSKPSLACSYTSPEAGPFDASLEDLPADSRSNIAIPDIDGRSNRPFERSDCNLKKACRVTSTPEQLAPQARSSANVGARSHHSNYEQRHTHIKTKTLSCVKESIYPRSVPPLDNSPGEAKSLPTNPARQQPEPCPKKEPSSQLNPVANDDCNSKRCSSDLSLSSNKSETEILDRSGGDPAISFEGLSTTDGTEHQTSDAQSTRTGSSVNCSEPLGLNQPNPHSREGLDPSTQSRHGNFDPATASKGSIQSTHNASNGDSRRLVVNNENQPSPHSREGLDSSIQSRHGNFEPVTASNSSTPSTSDARTGDFGRLIVNDENQSPTEAEIWTTKADGHLPKNGMAAETLSGLETHSSGESLISNDPSILERSRSSLAIRKVSATTLTDQKEPSLDKQAQKDPSRRNGSALGNLLTGKWLRTVVESKTPPVNHKASRRQGPASSTTHGTGNEIDGDETTDHVSDRIRNAKAGDAASTTSSSRTTINVNAVHDGSTVSRTATPLATPGLPADQSETVPEAASTKQATKGDAREGKSPFHQSILVMPTSADVSPPEYATYAVKSHAADKATAEKPAAANSGDLRLTVTFKDGTTHGPAIRRIKVTILLETAEDLMVGANVKKVEQESWRDSSTGHD